MNRNDQQFIAQKIRSQYVEKSNTELDELRMLDKKAKRPANVFAYSFGIISAIIMGTGMSLVMTDIGTALGITNATVPGIIIGAAGLAFTLLTYPIYKKILRSRKSKYSSKILTASEKLLSK